jgi:hypothetical protein
MPPPSFRSLRWHYSFSCPQIVEKSEGVFPLVTSKWVARGRRRHRASGARRHTPLANRHHCVPEEQRGALEVARQIANQKSLRTINPYD